MLGHSTGPCKTWGRAGVGVEDGHMEAQHRSNVPSCDTEMAGLNLLLLPLWVSLCLPLPSRRRCPDVRLPGETTVHHYRSDLKVLKFALGVELGGRGFLLSLWSPSPFLHAPEPGGTKQRNTSVKLILRVSVDLLQRTEPRKSKDSSADALCCLLSGKGDLEFIF